MSSDSALLRGERQTGSSLTHAFGWTKSCPLTFFQLLCVKSCNLRVFLPRNGRLRSGVPLVAFSEPLAVGCDLA